MTANHDLHTPAKTILLTFFTLFFLLTAPVLALDLPMNAPPSSTPTISKGDPVNIYGTATGHPSNGLQVWLIGNNYATVDPVSVDEDNTFSYELKPSETQNLASGQYFVLVQHPMMNGEFDVTYNANTGEVTRRVDNTALFRLTGSGRLQASDGASALVNAVGSQDIDDSFSKASFFISPPAASIDSIGDRVVGDAFVISGSTNLAVGNNLMVEIISSSFSPTTKMQSGGFSGASGTVSVEAGSGGYNRWSFPVDTSAWKADEYVVTASAVLQDVTTSTTFFLTDHPAPAPAATMEKATTAPAVTTPVTTIPSPAATPSAPAGIATALAGCFLLFLTAGRNRGKL